MDREQTIAVWDGGVRMRVLSAGAGPALVFLHGPWGLTWDSFLDDLARASRFMRSSIRGRRRRRTTTSIGSTASGI